jgi:hypothetical protein
MVFPVVSHDQATVAGEGVTVAAAEALTAVKW